MKLRIKNENFGSLTLFYGDKEQKTIIVPVNTLIDWYPLSNAYEYKLGKKKKYLVLKRLRSTLPVSYGITNNSEFQLEDEDHACCMEGWVNKAVQRENYLIVDKAKIYGLPIITQPFNKKVVDKGFNDLGIIFNNLKDIIVDKHLEGKTKNEIRLFKMKSEDSQLSEALQDCDDSVNYTYSELGQIYNMLLLMKKICRVREE